MKEKRWNENEFKCENRFDIFFFFASRKKKLTISDFSRLLRYLCSIAFCAIACASSRRHRFNDVGMHFSLKFGACKLGVVEGEEREKLFHRNNMFVSGFWHCFILCRLIVCDHESEKAILVFQENDETNFSHLIDRLHFQFSVKVDYNSISKLRQRWTTFYASWTSTRFNWKRDVSTPATVIRSTTDGFMTASTKSRRRK